MIVVERDGGTIEDESALLEKFELKEPRDCRLGAWEEQGDDGKHNLQMQNSMPLCHESREDFCRCRSSPAQHRDHSRPRWDSPGCALLVFYQCSAGPPSIISVVFSCGL